jgi:hypothetical protein
MIIQIHKFGIVLTSRQSGREAYAAFLPTLNQVGEQEQIIIDFEGVNALSPSWADEFFPPLMKKFEERITFRSTENLSVQCTLELLERIDGVKFKKEKIG